MAKRDRTEDSKVKFKEPNLNKAAIFRLRFVGPDAACLKGTWVIVEPIKIPIGAHRLIGMHQATSFINGSSCW